MPSNVVPALCGLTPATKPARPWPYSRESPQWKLPGRPVTPRVRTRVLLFTRTSMSPPGGGRAHRLDRPLAHALRRDDGQSRLEQDALGDVLVGAREAHDERHRQVDLPHRL